MKSGSCWKKREEALIAALVVLQLMNASPIRLASGRSK